MSLDFYACKVLQATDDRINQVYTAKLLSVDSAFVVRRLAIMQPTGLILVHGTRIGRNCLNMSWHQQYKLTGTTSEEADLDLIEAHERITAIFPSEMPIFLKKYVLKRRTNGIWFDPPKSFDEFDFYYVCW